jgi:hypothetical protein
MKNILLTTALIISGILTAQTVTFEYTYDAMGNRIKRKVIEIVEQTPEMANKNFKLENVLKEEETLAMTIDVYPNPATSYLNIKISEIKDASFTMLNTNGQNIASETINQTEYQIQLHTLPPGIYFLKIHNKGVYKEFKVIKN